MYSRARREAPYASLSPWSAHTHLSNEGLADAVLYGVLIVDAVREGIGETHD